MLAVALTATRLFVTMETMHAAGRRNLPPVPRPTAESLAERTIQLRRTDDPETVVPETAVPETVVPETVVPETAAPERCALDQTAPEAVPDLDAPSPAGDATVDGPVDDSTDDTADDGAGDRADGAIVDDTADDDTAIFPPAIEADLPDPEVLAMADEPELALDEDDPAQGFVSQLRAASGAFAAAAGAQSAVVREAVPPARHRRSRCRVVLRYADGAEADLTFLGSIGRPGTSAWEDFDRQIQQWLGDGQHRAPAWLVEDQEASEGVAVDVPAWLAAG